MPYKYQRKRNYRPGDRYGVKMYVPPEAMTQVADDRTRGLLNYYLDVAPNMHFLAQMEALETLVRSAYMQGCNDVIQAVINNPKIIVDTP